MSAPRDSSADREQTSYSDLDRADAAQARETDSDSAWAQFEALNKPPPATNFGVTEPASIPMPLPAGDPRYAQTVPAALTKDTVPAELTASSSSARRVTLNEAMTEVRRNNRVCPQPAAWQRLYEMLPGKRQEGRDWQPPPPMTGTAWKATRSLAKRMCLRDHLEWADKKGCLDQVYAYLKDLPETDWHYMD
jgi:hypothetical protein